MLFLTVLQISSTHSSAWPVINSVIAFLFWYCYLICLIPMILSHVRFELGIMDD
jgi:hypothetical protein